MHIALSADVYEAVRCIRQHFPDAPVFLVGFSIGAYTMTKYLGEADSGIWPDGKHILFFCLNLFFVGFALC